ncbi:MAG TPA: exodeoxyribonuclease VII large subunit, partial [Sphingobacterium bovisgrunnientis]|nr:exodeoxyribonuclease VII large subunit [Sphingobacterium bovisgrunnientis]
LPLDQLQEQLIFLSKNKFSQERIKLQEFAQALSWSSKNRLQQEKHNINILSQRLQLFSQHFLKEQNASLENIARLIKMADPSQLLKRGFSITRVNGKAVQSISDVQIGDNIETILIDGIIQSQVTSKQN